MGRAECCCDKQDAKINAQLIERGRKQRKIGQFVVIQTTAVKRVSRGLPIVIAALQLKQTSHLQQLRRNCAANAATSQVAVAQLLVVQRARQRGTHKNFILTQRPSSVGSVPASAVRCAARKVSAVSAPMAVGNVPLIGLSVNVL